MNSKAGDCVQPGKWNLFTGSEINSTQAAYTLTFCLSRYKFEETRNEIKWKEKKNKALQKTFNQTFYLLK